MKADILTIYIPTEKQCPKKCPYCISLIHPSHLSNVHHWNCHLHTVMNIAQQAGVSCLRITSDQEPMLAMDRIYTVGSLGKHFPIELQTNGLLLSYSTIVTLANAHINIICISVDTINQWVSLQKQTLETIHAMGMLTRITLNISDRFDRYPTLFQEVFEHPFVSQVTLKRITAPASADPQHPVTQWIQEHDGTTYFTAIVQKAYQDYIKGQTPYRHLIHFYKIWEIQGKTLAIFDGNCIADMQNMPLTTLVYDIDGHLYRNHNQGACIL